MRFMLLSLATVVAGTGLQSAAHAAFQVTLAVGAVTQTITDNGAGDTNALVNFIGAQGNIDGYSFQVNANTNTPSGGFAGQFVVQQAALITANTATTGPLTIMTSSDGFISSSPNPLTLQVFNALAESNFDRGVATAITTVTPPGGANGTTPVATVTGGSIPSSSDTTTRVVVSSNPFAISNTLIITGLSRFAGDPQGPQFNGTLTSTALNQSGGADNLVVPAPAGFILAATALPLFGLLRRRFGKPSAAVESAAVV